MAAARASPLRGHGVGGRGGSAPVRFTAEESLSRSPRAELGRRHLTLVAAVDGDFKKTLDAGVGNKRQEILHGNRDAQSGGAAHHHLFDLSVVKGKAFFRRDRHRETVSGHG